MDSVESSDQIGRLVERVAALEGRTTEAIAALKDDTKTIRAALHESNNTMTGFIGQHMSVVKQLEIHIAGCDKRGSRMEKAIWFGIATTLAVLGYLLQPHFRPAAAEMSAPAVVVQPANPIPERAAPAQRQR